MKGGVTSSKKRNIKNHTFNSITVKEKKKAKLRSQKIIFKPKLNKRILSKISNKSIFNTNYGRFMQEVFVVKFGILKVKIFKGDLLRRKTGTNYLVYFSLKFLHQIYLIIFI